MEKFIWVFVIVIEVICAFGCASIMKEKGRSYAAGWWIGLALGPFGFIIANCKSNATYEHSKYVESLQYQYDENGIAVRHDVEKHLGWKCICGRVHENHEKTCLCGCTIQDAVGPAEIPGLLKDKTSDEKTKEVEKEIIEPTREPGENEWLCFNCKTINSNEKKSCYYCGAIKDREPYR